MKRWLIAAAVFVVLAATAVVGFVTPGYWRYKHDQMQLGMFGVQEIRTDRFTGKKQVYGAGKWQPIEINGTKVYIPAGTEIMVH